MRTLVIPAVADRAKAELAAVTGDFDACQAETDLSFSEGIELVPEAVPLLELTLEPG